MDLRAEKEFIKTELDKVDDIHLVEAIKSILALGKAKDYERNLKPMTKNEFLQRDDISQKSIDTGDLIDEREARLYFAKKNAG